MQNDSFQQRFPSERIKERGGKRASWQVHFLLLLKWEFLMAAGHFPQCRLLSRVAFCKATWPETWSALTGDAVGL